MDWKEFLKQYTGAASSGLGAMSNMSGGLNQTNFTTRESIRDLINNFDPTIGFVTSAMDFTSDQLGIGLESMDVNAAENFDLGGEAWWNNTIASIPGLNYLGINGPTNEFKKSANIDKMTNSFSGSVTDINAAEKLAGKNTLFGKNKINNIIDKQKRSNDLISQISLESDLAKQNSIGELYSTQNLNKYSGFSPSLLLNAKKGNKIPELENARIIIKSKSGLKKFQLGGKINLIPDGALHKNKHHLEDENPELKGQITEKGIPVVVVDSEGDVVEQAAEIEKNEIIFAKPVTDQLEEYFKKWKESNDDEIAIECGKFLVTQILRNVDDQTNLRNKVE